MPKASYRPSEGERSSRNWWHVAALVGQRLPCKTHSSGDATIFWPWGFLSFWDAPKTTHLGSTSRDLPPVTITKEGLLVICYSKFSQSSSCCWRLAILPCTWGRPPTDTPVFFWVWNQPLDSRGPPFRITVGSCTDCWFLKGAGFPTTQLSRREDANSSIVWFGQ